MGHTLHCANLFSFSVKGAINCSICGVGYFTNTSGSTNCTACSPGRWNSLNLNPHLMVQSTSVTTFLNVLRKLFNSLAIHNRQVELHLSTILFNCVGSHADAVGSTKCKPCEEGQFQNMFGQKSCEPCGVGTWCRWSTCEFILSLIFSIKWW